MWQKIQDPDFVVGVVVVGVATSLFASYLKGWIDKFLAVFSASRRRISAAEAVERAERVQAMAFDLEALYLGIADEARHTLASILWLVWVTLLVGSTFAAGTRGWLTAVGFAFALVMLTVAAREMGRAQDLRVDISKARSLRRAEGKVG